MPPCRGAKKKKKAKKPVGDTPMQEMGDSTPAELSPEPEPQPDADGDDGEEASAEELEVRLQLFAARLLRKP